MSDQGDILTRALCYALTVAEETPIVVPLPTVQKVAEVLVACGVKQTNKKALGKIPDLPQWLREGIAAQSQSVSSEPVAPVVHPEGIARVGEAPEPPTGTGVAQ